MRTSNQAQRGFTLIELLIVVAVIGILSMVAFPSYQDYMTRSKIPDATSNLATKRVQMEQFFQDNRTYVGAPACGDTTGSQNFTFSCTAATANTYTLQALGKGAMLGFTYEINEQNAKSTPALPNTKWGAAPVTCWVTNKGGVC
jgi:type IV pilus assembly protein PilE